MNFLPGTVRLGSDDPTDELTDGTALSISAQAKVTDGQPVQIGLRPEHLVPTMDGGLSARVRLVEPTGAQTHLHVDLAGQDTVVIVDGALDLVKDATFLFSIQPELVHLFDDQTGQRLNEKVNWAGLDRWDKNLNKILIIGDSGVISQHTMAALVHRCDCVAVFRRGATASAETVVFAGDRHDQAALQTARISFQPSVVIDFACFAPTTALGLVNALPHSTTQLVFVSTVDVYGVPLPRLPMTEAAPWSPPGGAYAADKRATEDALIPRAIASDSERIPKAFRFCCSCADGTGD